MPDKDHSSNHTQEGAVSVAATAGAAHHAHASRGTLYEPVPSAAPNVNLQMGRNATQATTKVIEKTAAITMSAETVSILKNTVGASVVVGVGVYNYVDAYQRDDHYGMGKAKGQTAGMLGAGAAAQAAFPELPIVAFVAGAVVGEGVGRVWGLHDQAHYDPNPQVRQAAQNSLDNIDHQYNPFAQEKIVASGGLGVTAALVNLGGSGTELAGKATQALGTASLMGSDKAADYAIKHAKDSPIMASAAASLSFDLMQKGLGAMAIGESIQEGGAKIKATGHAMMAKADAIAEVVNPKLAAMDAGVRNTVNDFMWGIEDGVGAAVDRIKQAFKSDPTVNQNVLDDLSKKNWGQWVGDKDTKVELDELRKTLAASGVTMAQIDKDGNGKLDGAELSSALTNHVVKKQDQALAHR